MIYGKNRHATIIVAKNIPGYDKFVTQDFTKDFFQGEKIKLQYPPDHPNAGQYYKQTSTQLQGESSVFGVAVSEQTRRYRMEDDMVRYNKDFFYPYQTELTIATTPNFQTGLRPLSDRNTDVDAGKDAFILHGSIVEGTNSGAKRFYAGPYKGFTKEIQCVCTDTTSMNSLDGGDCDGWKKGSFYESGYVPERHNLFKYAGEPQIQVDPINPFNKLFLRGTPFGKKDYGFINIRSRQLRPIPYDMSAANDKGHSAILLTRKHALVSKFSDINDSDLKFYSPSEGIITATVASSVNTFKQIWDAIGFATESRDTITQEAFDALSKSFSPYKIVTFSTELPSDVTVATLLNIEESNPIFYGLVLSHEGRGHIGTFCTPLNKNTFDENNGIDLSFGQPVGCGLGWQRPYPLPGSADFDGTLVPVNSDYGSPILTYISSLAVFVGFVTGIGFVERKATTESELLDTVFDSYVRTHGCTIGSSKKHTMGWGSSYSPFDILNLYLSLAGSYKANRVSIVRFPSLDQYKYPYPDVSFDVPEQKAKEIRRIENIVPSIGVGVSTTELYRFQNLPYYTMQTDNIEENTISDFIDFR